MGERRITPQNEAASPFVAIRTHVDLGGSAHVFEVDSGCSIDTFDLSLKSDVPFIKRFVKRKTKSQTEKSVPIYEGRLIGLGNSLVNLEEIALMDLSLVTTIKGYKISGLIGAPVILKHGLGYDSVGNYYYMGISGVRKAFAAVHPLNVTDSNRIYGSAKIDNHLIEDLLIDTGQNAELSLDTQHFNFFVEHGTIRDLESARVARLDSLKVTRKGRLSSMELWGFKFENVPVLESYENRIGLSMLSRFDFFIDGKTSTISLSKSTDFFSPYIADLSGLSFALENEKIVVRGIREKSPAEKCGFIEGDTLISINGVALESNWKGLTIARKHFSAFGPTSSTILVMRQDREIQLTISR